VNIVARTQNPLSGQGEPTETLHGEINLSDLYLIWWHSSGVLSGIFTICPTYYKKLKECIIAFSVYVKCK